ncbi:MAG: BMP family ABC transporter substrate-binding protein [Actinobacteria bacterium]|nr:BMP family ABC transporter substrate-binding protein [Actinomycetota bacterium]
MVPANEEIMVSEGSSSSRRPVRRAGIAAVALIAVLGLFTAACSSSKSSDSAKPSGPTKAAWIYVGPINDGGWTQTHNEGREAAVKALGDNLISTYKENVPEGPETAQVIDDLVKDGNTVIFATSYGFKDAMQAAAKKYPNVKFVQATGDDITINGASSVSSNYDEYWGAGEDTLYLTGIAAGKATKNNVIGVEAPFPIPEIIRQINGFTLGAQSVNPEVTVKVVWTKSWFDPAAERQAAESLVAGGADVIFSHQDSPTAGEVAKANSLPWVGYDSDQSAAYPTVWLTAATYDWGPYYTAKLNSIREGKWSQQNYYGTIGDEFTTVAPFGSLVSAETKSAIEAEQSKAAATKTFGWFWGLADREDQAGTVQIKKGATLSQKDLYTMSYFVKGIDGSPKG